jgi:hypothetical protein
MEKEGLKKGIELYTRVNNLLSRPGLKELKFNKSIPLIAARGIYIQGRILTT